MTGRLYKKGTVFGKPRSEVVKHPGVFSAAAKRHGETTHEYAEKEKGAAGKLGRRARLALTFEGMRKNR
jgi:hypothetical protein